MQPEGRVPEAKSFPELNFCLRWSDASKRTRGGVAGLWGELALGRLSSASQTTEAKRNRPKLRWLSTQLDRPAQDSPRRIWSPVTLLDAEPSEMDRQTLMARQDLHSPRSILRSVVDPQGDRLLLFVMTKGATTS